MLSVSTFILLLPLVTSRDVAIGLNSYGRKIFDENRQASPAIWRQKENVTIEASNNEVISKVLIIDMRPEKDGDAKIVDGGAKQKNVTIELKSPTVFRGYDFHIEVYAVPEAHLSNTDQQTENSSEKAGISINDKSISTQSPKISNTVSEQSTTEPESNDTIRNARNLNMENEMNESKDTAYKNITVSSGNETSISEEDATTISDNTTAFYVTTTDLPEKQTTSLNLPDFPLTGMEGDETRHIRKIGDDLYTSTINILTTTIEIDSTTESYALNNNTETTPENGTNGNNTKIVGGVEDETVTTTVSDISTTPLSEESATISPDKNGKDIPDFDDLLSTDGEETRFVRHTNTETDSTTNSDISTTKDGQTTTIIPDGLNDLNNETRNSREALYNTTSDTTRTSDEPQINNVGDQIPPILQIIIENGAYDMNIVTNKPNEDENDVTESSVDFNSTDNVGDVTTIAPGVPQTTMASTESNESSTEEQFRKGRGISEENDTFNPDTAEENPPNYPVFVDPSIINKSNIGDDYVYVPILAVISKHNYPVFRGVLDNISMNVAFSSLDTNTTPVEAQVSNEMPDTESKPVISVT